MTLHAEMIKRLNDMDEKQLLELMHDLDIKTVERLECVVYEHISNYDYEAAETDNDNCYMQELIDDDNTQRAHDCASERNARRC